MLARESKLRLWLESNVRYFDGRLSKNRLSSSSIASFSSIATTTTTTPIWRFGIDNNNNNCSYVPLCYHSRNKFSFSFQDKEQIKKSTDGSSSENRKKATNITGDNTTNRQEISGSNPWLSSFTPPSNQELEEEGDKDNDDQDEDESDMEGDFESDNYRGRGRGGGGGGGGRGDRGGVGGRGGGGGGRNREYFNLGGEEEEGGGGGGRGRGGFGNRNNFNFNDRQRDNFRRGTLRESEFADSNIEWNRETLIPFRKDFYKEHPAVSQRPDDEVEKMRQEARMLIFGKNVPKPFRAWEESGIPEQYLKSLRNMEIHEPTPIQQQGIPMALSGRDLIGVSRTGSGKTLAYLLPLLVHVEAQPVVKEGDGPIGLIIGPTRELVQQINFEISKYTRANPDLIMKHAAVYGGADRNTQIRELGKYPDILVATPGRLLDLTTNDLTNFKRTTYLVLDEADRMLDMGFRKDLEKILTYIRPDKQMLMWSATWPHDISQLAHNYMKNPIRVQIGSTELTANELIDQNFKYLPQNEKTRTFVEDIREIVRKDSKCLVFVNTKRAADLLETVLGNKNINARAIHGDKTQSMRDRIMNEFRKGEAKVLIATDVVSRGIDIRDIDVVLIYDFPNTVEDYVHRIGRTARGQDSGVALTYLTPTDVANHGRSLFGVLQKANQKIPPFLQKASR